MAIAVKKHGKVRHAWRLGDGCPMEKKLTAEGMIIPQQDGTYRLRSQEVADGDEGQLARKGDWFLLGDKGYPYPNEAEWFASHHRHVEGDLYEQIPSPCAIWRYGDPMFDGVEYVVSNGLLTIKDGQYEAVLWGTLEHAPLSHVVVFYSINRDANGDVTAVDFNLVDGEEFEKNYEIIG